MKMRKSLFFGAFAAAGILFTTASCSSDATDANVTPNATVSFKVSANASQLSRAISDGTGADQLVYRVFDKDGNVISGLEKKTDAASDLTTGHTVTLTLAKGQTYKVAFWAQSSTCDAYTVDDNMSVAVDYTSKANNDESRDAFFKTVDITVTGNAVQSVELKRPFAQLNVADTDEDKAAAEASGIVVKTSSVTVKNAATTLDVKTGKVSGEAEVTYMAADIPTEKLSVDMDGDGTKEDYNYLSMCYVLPNDAVDGTQKTVAEASFTFHSDNGEDILLKDGLQNIPLQRNYRTNIVGNILAANAVFNVKVDANYEGDYNTDYNKAVVSNSAELATAVLTPNTVVKLQASADAYTLPSTIADNVTITGEGASTTISALSSVTYSGKNVKFENLTYDNAVANYVGIQHAASVTYTNCTIKGRPTLYATNCAFNSCTFDMTGTYDYCVWTYGADNTTFNACIFNTQGKAVKVYNENGASATTYNVTLNNCTFTAANVPGGKGKACVEVDGTLLSEGKSFNVVINHCTQTGHVAGETSGELLWNCDANSKATVTVDGTVVYKYPTE